jgi:hypothetical protein
LIQPIDLLPLAKDIEIWKDAMVNEDHNKWLLSLNPQSKYSQYTVITEFGT